ncbi:MAG: hypothetical protein IJW49_00365 [Clostridia bacterium]|nr:hypothetical protein [Clostridia bacterium]
MRNNKEKKAKKQKEKIIYVDDGSTVVDMSAFGKPKKETPDGSLQASGEKPKPRWRMILSDYFASVKMMFFPMLAVMGIISVAFLIVFLILNLFR